ncbi:hypothetical protein H0H81_007043 [Sphagnurus paluster]|uniref:BRCT domain-containing protein n=1 Tax=Sphagnurus paluster TaxID=117069 RepID=A0A9P7KLT0_9AGAR|nr:hypothetical protein H0H81_007043 [Sphagnurus paluster]
MHLFDGVRYLLSPSLPEQRALDLSQALENDGAVRVNSLDDPSLTHIITNTNRFERWQDVAEREEAKTLHVVTTRMLLCRPSDDFLGRRRLRGRGASHALTRVAQLIAPQLPTQDLEVLSAGIEGLGGQWRTGLTKDVTHLFVVAPTSDKYTTALHFQEHTRVKILLPHWFDDSVRLGLPTLDTKPYEWPDPPLLRGPLAGTQQTDKRPPVRRLDAEKKALFRTSEVWEPGAPLPDGNPGSQSSASGIMVSPGKGKNVWQGRRVLLGRSLALTGARHEAVEAEIRRAGGEIVPCAGGREEEAQAVEQCDVYVTRYRCGKAYVQAVRKGKTIGTLPWVFYVHSTGVLSRPMDQLLWYPIPKRTIDGFTAHEITVTNYTGQSREYIKKLITAMGATFTPSMSGKNTVLIAAEIKGTKTTKAASWSIPIVNHLWLEDCFIKWRNLTVATQKYISFPATMDLSMRLGERGVGREVEKELKEEDLEALEMEDEMDENENEMEQEKLPEPELKRAPAPGTQNSARDAREVEEFVGAGMDVDGDVPMQMQAEPAGTEHPAPAEELPQEIQMAVDQEEAPAEPDNEQDEPPAPSKPSPTPRSSNGKTLAERMQDKGKGESAAKTRVKPRSKGRPAKADVDNRSATPEIRATRRKSGQLQVTPVAQKRGRGRAASVGSTSNDEHVEVVQQSGKSTGTGTGTGRKLVRRLGDRNESWVLDAVVVTPLKGLLKEARDDEREAQSQSQRAEQRQKRALKKSPSKTVLSDDDEDGESEIEVVAIKKSRKMVDEDEEMEVVEVVSRKGKQPARKKMVSDDDEMEVEVKKGKRKSIGKKPDISDEDVEPVKSKGRKNAAASTSTAKPKSKSKSKVRAVSEDESEPEVEDEDDMPVIMSVSKGKGKAERPKPTPVRKEKKVATPPVSEDDEEPPPPPAKKTPLKTYSKRGRNKAPRPASEDEEEDDHDHSPPPTRRNTSKSQASKRKAPALPVSDDEEEEDALPSPKKTTPAAKPRLSSSKKATKAPVQLLSDEDDDTTPPPLVVSPPKKTKAPPASKAKKSSKPKQPVSDEDEGESDGSPPAPPPKKKATTTARPRGRQSGAANAEPAATPQRTVSVLLPNMTLSTKKPAANGTKDATSTPLTRTESIRATAGERASTSRPSAAVPSSSKPKAKPKPAPAPPPAPAPASSPPPTSVADDDSSVVISGRSRRTAAAKATQRLHEEIMPDVMNYQQEMKKGRKSVGGGVSLTALPPATAPAPVASGSGAGKKRLPAGDDAGEGERDVKRRKMSLTQGDKKGKGKATVEEMSEDEEPVKSSKAKGKRKATEDDEDEVQEVLSAKPDGKARKSAKTEDLNARFDDSFYRINITKADFPFSVGSKKVTSNVRLMTTQVALSDDVVRALTKLGVKITTRPAECTHLLAPHLVRTEKFICALAHAAFILTEKWATESAAAKKLLDEEKYLLRDEANEKKFDFVLADALARAKKLGGTLFAKKVFYITPKVSVDIKLLRNVVTACGGQVRRTALRGSR